MINIIIYVDYIILIIQYTFISFAPGDKKQAGYIGNPDEIEGKQKLKILWLQSYILYSFMY